MTKKQKFVLLSVASVSAIALIGVSSFASNENGLLKANAAYTSSHTLTMNSSSSFKPTSTAAYQISDSSLGLHEGGYMYAQFEVANGTVSFDSDDIFSISTSSYTDDANIIVYLWATGIESFTADFSYVGTEIKLFKSEAYAESGYPAKSSSSHAVIEFTSGVQKYYSLSGADLLVLTFQTKNSAGDFPNIKLTSLVVNFTC
jgi:hypothetical protein